MSIFPRSYRKKKSGYACALSSGILVLSLALAAPAAYAAMGGGGLPEQAEPARPWSWRSRRWRGGSAEAGTPKQLIARMVKQNLRPALRAWFGTPRIKDAWPGTAGCGLAPELTEHRLRSAKAPSDERLALLGPWQRRESIRFCGDRAREPRAAPLNPPRKGSQLALPAATMSFHCSHKGASLFLADPHHSGRAEMDALGFLPRLPRNSFTKWRRWRLRA